MRVLAAVLAVAAAGGCGGEDDRPDPARALCAAARREGEVLVAAYVTDVGAVRKARVGPRVVAPQAFPASAETDAAAWCWADHGEVRQIYAAGPGGLRVDVVTTDRNFSPAPGPPAVL